MFVSLQSQRVGCLSTCLLIKSNCFIHKHGLIDRAIDFSFRSWPQFCCLLLLLSVVLVAAKCFPVPCLADGIFDSTFHTKFCTVNRTEIHSRNHFVPLQPSSEIFPFACQGIRVLKIFSIYRHMGVCVCVWKILGEIRMCVYVKNSNLLISDMRPSNVGNVLLC
jgi:hypothetical protein